MTEAQDCDVIVIGAGIAGARCSAPPPSRYSRPSATRASYSRSSIDITISES